MDGDTDTSAGVNSISVAVGVGIILGLTLLLVVGVGTVLFELESDEGGPPEVDWQVDPSDPPVLHHRGGDSVDCERIIITGDFTDGETLCEYLDGDVMQEGDSATLMPLGGGSGTITLEWHDVETGRITPITEPFTVG